MTGHQNHTRGFIKAFPDSLKAFGCCQKTQTTKAAADSDQASPQLSLPVPLSFYESRLLGSITLFLHLYNKFPTDFSRSTGATCCTLTPQRSNRAPVPVTIDNKVLGLLCAEGGRCMDARCPYCLSLGHVVRLTFTSVVSRMPQRRRSHSNNNA